MNSIKALCQMKRPAEAESAKKYLLNATFYIILVCITCHYEHLCLGCHESGHGMSACPIDNLRA